MARLKVEAPQTFVIPMLATNEVRLLNSEIIARQAGSHLSYLQDRGYPFASLVADSLFFTKDTLLGTLKLQPGPLRHFDSLIVKGYSRFPDKLLRYELEYREGMRYSETYLLKLPQYAKRVEYLNMSRPPAVAFTKDKSLLYLYLEEVKSNLIDGVVGLNTDENGKVTLNGDFRLRLLNALHKGEEIKLRWRRPGEGVQSLDLGLGLPYIFRSPFWLEGSFNIYRQDSSFTRLSAQALVKYVIETGSFLNGGINYRSSSAPAGQGSSLEGKAGRFSSTFYKLGMEFNHANRAIVPTKGFRFTGYGSTGRRQYEGTSTRQYSWELDWRKWWPLFNQRHVLHSRLSSEALFGENLLINELYLIGGLSSLRGFNEQSIFSSAYGIASLEYRYMIGQYDYLALFTDLAYSEQNTIDNFQANLLNGIGTGINFETGAGIFSLFLAVGRDKNNPYDFRAAKVHFGYVNRF